MMMRVESRHPLAIRRAAAVEYIKMMGREGRPMGVVDVMVVFNVGKSAAYNYLAEAGLVADPSIGDRPAEVKALREQGLSYGQIMERTGLTKSQVRYALRKA